MKTKILLASSLAFVFAVSSTFALDGANGTTVANESVRFVTQNSASTPLASNQCLWANETVNYYLNWDLNQDGIPDLGKVQFFTDNYRYYGGANTYRLALHTMNSNSRKGTEVRYYLPEQRVFQIYHNNALTNIANTPVWFRASNVFPLNQWTRALSSEPVLISAPANKNNNSFQVAYQIRHAVFRGYKNSWNGSYVTMPVRNGDDNLEVAPSNIWWLKKDLTNGDGGGPLWKSDFVNQLNSVSTKAIEWSNNEYTHDYECVNVKLAWCGDGKVQQGAYSNGQVNEKCDPADSTKAGWGNKGCDPVSCQPINATQEPVYDLALTKRITDKKPMYKRGDLVTFTITVFNQGNKDARNIQITDYIPEGLEVVDQNWTISSNKATRIITETLAPNASKSLTLQMRIKSDFRGNEIINLAEISKDNAAEYGLVDRDSTPDQNKDNDCFLRDNLHIINGNGKAGSSTNCTPATDEDDHDGESLQLLDQIYDLALTKTIQNQKDSYTKGENITFAVTVYNQGELVARNIEVTDYLLTGLELKDANWTQENGMIKTTIAGPINPGQSKTVTLTTRIKPDFSGTDILNLAEISKDNSGEYGTTDKDSTPDKNKNNDCFLEGKHLITGNGKAGSPANCNETTDEDDHDGVRFPVRDPKKPIYDLALTKQVKAPRKNSYSLGDELTFVITVHNQGELVARNIEVTDYLPKGLILKDSKWTFDPQTRKATYQIPGEITVSGPNSSRSIEMNVVIDGDFKGSTILNKAEISRDNASDYGTVDKDSTPDQNADNDCFSESFLHRTSGNGKAGSVANCNETTDEDDHDGDIITIAKPTIKKDLQEVGKVYQEGDLVGFKMPFANNTNDTVNNVSIKDFMPLNLEYVSSEIHGVNAAYHQTYLSGAITVDEWSGFNLLPSQNGVLYLTGRVLKTNLDSRLNTVGIFTNDILVQDDSEHYDLWNRKVIIQKLVDKQLVASGEIAQYTIKVTATEGAYDELVVVDTLPKGVVYQEGSYKLGASNTLVTIESATTGVNAQGLQTVTWRVKFPQKLSKNQTFSIVFDGKLTVGERKPYTNVACVEDPKKPNDAPLCDKVDIIPPPPPGPRPHEPTVQIKKYVNKSIAESGREDVLMTGFAQGQTGYFTLEAQNASAAMNTFTITDTIEGNLSYVDSSDLLNNAFTGVLLRGSSNSAWYKYTTTQTVEKLSNNTTRLTWKVVMTEGQFLPEDKYQVQFKVKVNGDQRNVAFIEYPGGKWSDDASVKTEDVKLTIKKYVSDKIDGTYNDDGITLSNNTTAFFKLVVSGATNSLTGFVVKDTIKDNLKFDFSSTGLANNAFTGVIAFGAQNPNKPAYKITPTISGTYPTDIEWKVEMLNGNFMPGDSLTIIFKATKLGTQENVATVEYPKRDGTIGKSSDPARVRSHSTPPSTPPSTPSNGGWGGYYSPSCGNGYKNGYEICDLGPNGGTIGPDGKLFSSQDIYDKKYAGYTCTASCGLKNKGEQIAPKCFNLQNGSISIMKWEVLPFYWNLDGMAGKATIQEKQDWLKDHYVENKDKADSTPKIDISSMKCTFKVYGPGRNLSNVVYDFTAPCFNSIGWQDALHGTYSSIKDYINQNRNGWLGGSHLANQGRVKNVFDTLDNQGQYPVLFPLSSKLLIRDFGQSSASLVKSNSDVSRLPLSNIQTFGEYKVALERIDYNLVSKGEKDKLTEEKKNFDDRICEVDFAVTDHYMIQRSPYGIGNKATKDLKAYKLMKWDSFISDGKLFGTERAVEQDYAPSKELQKQFITFKNKYQKLAKPVKGKEGLSKVPGKAIYFYEGTQEITDLLKNATKQPFTLIASKGQNLTIKGDLDTNAMIMTQGTITFDATNACNGKLDRKGHAGQIVKGIFYAGAGFQSSEHDNLKNTYEKLSKGDRCNYGNLHIKGVAIGDLSKVVAARRSELYTWFQGNGGGKDGGEKVQKIINGASVLVDYNPTLRGNLPPGANEFNKALAVYRK